MKTFQDTFKELNLTQLEIYAERWAKKFSIEFDRIILFKNLNPRQALHEDVMQASIPGRYLVLFELLESASSAFEKILQATAEEAGILSEDLSTPAISAIWKHLDEKYDRLLRATGRYNTGRYDTILDPNINTALKMLIDDNFHRVYNTKPDYDFRDDWKFRVKDPNEDLPLGVQEEDGYFGVLYDSSKKDLPVVDIQNERTEEDHEYFPPDIIDLMNNARPGIDLIYKIIKEGVGFKDGSERAIDDRMEEALYFFEKEYYEDRFKKLEEDGLITKEDLKNRDIYNTSYEHWRRSFIGKLLQTILKRCGFKRYSYAKLFNEYQRQKGN